MARDKPESEGPAGEPVEGPAGRAVDGPAGRAVDGPAGRAVEGPAGRAVGGEDVVDAFARWAAGMRVDEAAAARRRERWLRQQAAEDATFAGVLVDLAERQASVTIEAAGARLQGRLVGVGQDFCVLEDPRGVATVVALGAVSALRTGNPGRVDPGGQRPAPLELDLAGALGALAAERAPVRLVGRDGMTVAGRLLAVGHDVLTLDVDQPAPPDRARRHVVYVPLEVVAICTPR